MAEVADNEHAGIWQDILSQSTTAEGVSIEGRTVVVLGTLWSAVRREGLTRARAID